MSHLYYIAYFYGDKSCPWDQMGGGGGGDTHPGYGILGVKIWNMGYWG